MSAARAVVGAGLTAAALSGAPSGVAWAAGRLDAVDATRRIGRAFFGRDSVVLGGIGHLGVSLFWATAAPTLARRRRPLLWGAAYGAAIYALDFKLLAPRFFPAFVEIDGLVQLADHLAYGMTVVEAARRLQG